MKVWVIEHGCYDTYVSGVFATLEAAQAAFPKGEWKQSGEDWVNGLDWDEYATITEMKVQG